MLTAQGLVLGQLVATGGQAQLRRGTLHGEAVAIKVVNAHEANAYQHEVCTGRHHACSA